jgi:hypothetical protein
LALFTIGGVDLTAALNALFEAHGGAQNQANIYSLALPNSVLAAIGPPLAILYARTTQ